jgi:hypothetical protein
VNGDGQVNVGDAFYLINYLFASGPAPVCSGDVNGDTQVNVGDVFYLINYLFAGGPPPQGAPLSISPAPAPTPSAKRSKLEDL